MRSLRSRLILSSLLWTGGLLALMHMLALVTMHIFPGSRHVGIALPVFIGVLLMSAGIAGVQGGLKPFRYLRERLAAVRTGQDRRVTGKYPTEVQPLIDDLNSLLEERERAVKRALDAAGDLAHGLKTPLAVIVQEAENLHADAILQQVDRMRKQVDYQLARARAAASAPSTSARTNITECAQALSRTLGKLHAGRQLHIRVDADPNQTARVQREDLDEMLGNLMDNACKWTTSQVVLTTAQPQHGVVTISVDDNGPGIAPGLRTVVLRRGIRADEAAPGSGLGLAIVRDLVELYGGTITLGTSPQGGLRAELTLPC